MSFCALPNSSSSRGLQERLDQVTYLARTFGPYVPWTGRGFMVPLKGIYRVPLKESIGVPLKGSIRIGFIVYQDPRKGPLMEPLRSLIVGI